MKQRQLVSSKTIFLHRHKHTLYEPGFAYCWSGARGNVGITGGKYYFGCRIVSFQPVDMEDTDPDQQNVCRIGTSRGDDSVGKLGETEHSYGFDGTGKFSNAGGFQDYGERFRVGDTIICLVDLESKPVGSLEFCKNGRRLGVAKKFDSESALFPHVLLKNTVVRMQFSLEDGLIHIEGYKPWNLALKDEKAIVGPSLSKRKDCEVLMMVGLPASGKSTWAEKCVKENPEKRYILLGTNLALDQMKVPGSLRKNNYGEQFDKIMEQATGIFNTLLSRASKVPRNYIIDETNVYKNARKWKLGPFAIYQKIAVVVFPSAEELKLRAEKRYKEMGIKVPPEAVNEMLANFVLPKSKSKRWSHEKFDKVIFTELNRLEAQQQLDEMKRALAPSSVKKLRSGPRHANSSAMSAGVGETTAGRAQPNMPPYHAYVDPALPTHHANVDPAVPTYHSYVYPFVPTYTANVNTGYRAYMPPAGVGGVQPYQTNVPSYGPPPFPYPESLNPVYTQYDGYMHTPVGTQPYGPPAGTTTSAHQYSLGPSYATPNPIPYGYQNPIPYGHHNPSPYRQDVARPYGNPSSNEQYVAGPNGGPGTNMQYGANPYFGYASYPTTSAPAPAPGGTAYFPPRSYR